ncbi:MAG: glutamine synthetase adenylyltransferase [Arcticibacterium sp.]
MGVFASINIKMTDFLKIIIPCALLLAGMYLFAKSFLNKQIEQRKLELKSANSESILPTRLQAYERMTLFLERITPNYLLLRLYEQAVHVNDFQAILLKEIREEYYHNLAQQIYISPETWDEIKGAMNEMLTLVNQSAAELKADDSAINLSKRIFDKVVNEERDPTQKALLMLKVEVQSLLG